MNQYKGKLIVHTGSMFSGKTKGLETDIIRFKIANYKAQVFKPVLDNRYTDAEEICTHDGYKLAAQLVDTNISSSELLSLIDNDTEVVGIDEVQFFNKDAILSVIVTLLNKKKTVVVAGLDMTYQAEPFGIMPYLMSVAEYVHKHQAVCMQCGNDAWVSYRTSNDTEQVVVGGVDKYIPLCRSCYDKQLRKDRRGE